MESNENPSVGLLQSHSAPRPVLIAIPFYKNEHLVTDVIGSLLRNAADVTAIGGERAILIEYPDDDLSIVVLTNLMGSYPEAWVDGVADLYFSGKMNDWRDALG